MSNDKNYNERLIAIYYAFIIFCAYIIVWNIQAYLLNKNHQFQELIGINSISDFYIANTVLATLTGILILALVLIFIKIFMFLLKK